MPLRYKSRWELLIGGGGERLRDVVVPGQRFFVDQCPDETKSRGCDRENTACEPGEALTARRGNSVEVENAQMRPAGARRIGFGEGEDHFVAEGQECSEDGEAGQRIGADEIRGGAQEKCEEQQP